VPSRISAKTKSSRKLDRLNCGELLLIVQYSAPMAPRHPSLVALSHDHHHGLALALRCRKQALGQLKPIGAVGLAERAQEFLHFYKSSLTRHFEAEERVLFPAMRTALPASAALVDALVHDHQQIRQSLPELESKMELAKLLFDLGDLLERHIRKEERELFPLFESGIETAEAERIGRELKTILMA
jgi:hemerythrin-like domain-containing protein